MTRRSGFPWPAALYLALSLLFLLVLGAVVQRRAFETRGIPQGLPSSIPHGGARPALNVALEQYDDNTLDDALTGIGATGVTAIKQSFYFTARYDWQQSDRLVNAAGAHGLRMIPLLDGDPARQFAPPADPAEFAAWAGEFAGRYGDQIDGYIIWDEPNLASHWGGEPVNPAAYAALLTATSAAIRSADAGAVIVAAPLAPTREEGPNNLADPLFLQELYEVGAGEAFDVAAGKPYGFDNGPDDRAVDVDVLNFSRIILLREVLLRNGDEHKAIWAGNWGWNSLPYNWAGSPSLWGQTDPETQAARTLAAVERARREWPWMGYMFLEGWEPDVPAGDPRHGFRVAGRPVAEALLASQPQPGVAYPGFHLAHPEVAGQAYAGEWRFAPEFGADVPPEATIGSGTVATLQFWGTDVGARVRHSDFRARFYATVDGVPANALPRDETGAALVLTAPDPSEDYLETEPIALDLAPGLHTLILAAHRGWDQWALNGFSVAYHPPAGRYRLSLALLALAASASLLAAWRAGRAAPWRNLFRGFLRRYAHLGRVGQLALTGAVALLVTLGGWLTWGEQAAGIYRRLGDPVQIGVTAAAAALFYFSPFFVLYLLGIVALFFLVYARPAWGLALVAFSFPFWVKPRPLLGYRFSPVEVFLLVTFASLLARGAGHLAARLARETRPTWSALIAPLAGRRADTVPVLLFVTVATLSLFFTERLDVALNEWRVVIVEPALFYFLLLAANPRRQEMWVIVDAFVLGGVVVALYGLTVYALCAGAATTPTCESVTTVVGGLARLRAIYGSPNNLALYLGRVLPFLAAMALVGSKTPLRRLAYALAFLPAMAALLLTFSKGALFLGVPAAAVLLLLLWGQATGRRVWPVVIAAAALATIALLAALNVPALAARLSLQGTTSFFRIHLWQASLNMIADHPLFGVGLDNFLYAYRGRYIFEAAWQEPDLNHPHNIFLDFATRLGLVGLLAGGWLLWSLARHLRTLWRQREKIPAVWLPVLIGLISAFAAMLAHGLVDHSFFLIDLSFAFYLFLGLAAWLASQRLPGQPLDRSAKNLEPESEERQPRS